MLMIKNYFSDNELKCKCCGFLNVDYVHLCNINKLRVVFGLPILVNSCCRCIAHNKSVGGKKNSKHIVTKTKKCKATDIRPVNSFDLERLYLVAVRSKLFEDVILYRDKKFIHVESR